MKKASITMTEIAAIVLGLGVMIAITYVTIKAFKQEPRYKCEDAKEIIKEIKEAKCVEGKKEEIENKMEEFRSKGLVPQIKNGTFTCEDKKVCIVAIG